MSRFGVVALRVRSAEDGAGFTQRQVLTPTVPLRPRPQRQVQHRLSSEQVAELVSQYCSGVSLVELARTFGVHESTVRAQLRRNEVEPRSFRKLHGELLQRAIELFEAGASFRAIGRELGLNRQTVAAAVRKEG